jgi:KTSC domain
MPLGRGIHGTKVPVRSLITMPHLQSLAIETVTYDQSAHSLRATYRVSGETVIFDDVPQEIYDSLIFADSIGAYFQDNIEGQFPARKVGRLR